MPGNKIKGITVEIGGDTTKLGKALQDVEKKSRSLSGELGQINKLLKLDPGNTELLAQKQEVLAQAIETTSSKLEALRAASEHAAKTSANYDAWKKKMDPLQDAIDATTKELREMQEAAASAKEDFGVDSAEYQAAAETVSDLRQRLKTLRDQVKEVNEEFDNPVSAEQARELERAIVATESKLKSYEQAARETSDQLDRLGRGESIAAQSADDVARQSGKAAGELDDMGDEANQASDETERLDDSASNAAKAGLTALAAAATAALTGIVACAESSREYRAEMAKLTTAFESNGFSSQAATAAYEDLQGILGETDQAVEAANHLAQLTQNEQELATWTGDILPGVFATFGASLPIENLTEAANETARTGTVVGGLADALNWAADEGETFGVAMRENTEANEEWNTAVSEAASAEDYFNLALQECSSEQERQQLITQTLTKLYKSAATQYKKTNAEVIRSNKATEKWNKATAQIGETVEPVVTDLKELGAELLEDLVPGVENMVDGSDDLIDRLKKIATWVRGNIPTIKAGIVGIAGALVTYKAATIAAQAAQGGLTAAINASTIATKALSLAQAATPWGLVAVAVGGVLTALIAYDTLTQDAAESTSILTEAEEKQVEASREAAEEFREMQQASQEAADSTLAQLGHVSALADELQSLADESGQVQEADQARAQYILGELNDALGTEYTMTGNQIDQYGELTDSVYAAIEAKKAEALLEAYNDDWVTALQNEQTAYEAMTLANKDYQAQITAVTQLQQQLSDVEQQCTEAHQNAQAASDESTRAYWAQRAAELENRRADLSNQLVEETNILNQKKAAYDQSAIDYGNYQQQISNYESAEMAAMQGNYATAIQLLNGKSASYAAYADDVDAETAQVLGTLQKEAVDAGLAAEDTKAKFEAGVDGYTLAMVDEAEKNYQKALDQFASAYSDAYSVGQDLGSGMADGSGSMAETLKSKARSLVSGFISSARKEADSHSPSRKMIAFGEDLGEGAVIGIENTTGDAVDAAQSQVREVLAAYQEADRQGQRTMSALSRSTSAAQTQQINAGDAALLDGLQEILKAIKAGQVIMLDGKTVVGKTAAAMDASLAQRSNLIARGAV